MERSRIYIVEDSFIVSLHLRKILEQEGYTIVGHSDNGEQAIPEILALNPDLVLMDVMLNGEMDGVEIVAELKKVSNIPVIYITALTNKETIRRIKFTDPHSYLKKPFDDTEVLNVIEVTLQKILTERSKELAQTSLHNTVNNLSVMIWSIDRSFRLTTANHAFSEYLAKKYGIVMPVGESIENYDQLFGDKSVAWKKMFERAFAGEVIKGSSAEGEPKMLYTINPIYKKTEIIGASVSLEDVSSRVEVNKELSATEAQLGELKLMALRSAVNPHFIFNTLNAIQYLIIKEDRENAMKHLAHFSKLVRSVLKHSMNSRVLLSEELDLLNHYIALEMLRFEGKFNVEFDVDRSLTNSALLIPPFILQPYVENAILHGMNHQEGPGKIKIAITRMDDKIQVIIEDNGIGREAGKALLFNNDHEGGLIQLDERIQRMHPNDKVKTTVEDLKDANEKILGIKVTIILEAEEKTVPAPAH